MADRRRPFAPLCLVVVAAAPIACSGYTPPRAPAQAPVQFDVIYRDNGSRSRDVIPRPVEEVVRLMPEVYQEIGLPGALGQDRDGVLVFMTPHMKLLGGRPLYEGERTSTYISCGTNAGLGANADTYDMNFVLLTWLRPTEAGYTLVESLIDGHARSPRTNANSVACHGTGKMEKQIADGIRRRLRAAQAGN